MFWSKFRDRDVYLQIVLLDCHQLEYKCKASANGQELLDFVLDYLNIVERKYFGLRYLDAEDQVHWLDTKKQLKRQLRKCTEPYVFYFCIKFYAADPCELNDEATRTEFFLQVWEEVSHERLPVPFEELAELGARVLQYEIGDFSPIKHKPGYSAALTFAPEKNVRLEQKIEGIHRSMRGMTGEETVMDFLDRAKRLDLYGVELHPVIGEDESRYFAGLSPTGIMLVHNDVKVGMYDWLNVVRIRMDLDFRWQNSRSARINRGGTVLVTVRNFDGVLNTFGFRLATRSACKHLHKTAEDYARFYQNEGDVPMRSPSIVSKFFRRSGKHRSSSRGESEMMSVMSEARSIASQPRAARPSIRRHDRPAVQATVIYEDDERTIIKDGNGELCQQLKLPPITRNPSRDLINLRVPSVAAHYVRSVPSSSKPRSQSPMSIQSSWSTAPRRLPEPLKPVPVDAGNDSDSVFSDTSRAVSDAETLKRKRKRSVMTENNSSGASEENDQRSQIMPRGELLRSSLGPQRRKGRNQMRFKTMDGASIRTVLSQLNAVHQVPAFTPVPVIHPARSLNYLNSNTLNPPVTPSFKVLKEFNFDVNAGRKKEPTVFEFAAPKSTFSFKFDAPRLGSPLSKVPASLSGSQRSIRTVETPKLTVAQSTQQTEVDMTPRHVRSLSSTEKTSVNGQNIRRSRIRSDSHFTEPTERMASPFASPFPIIPPPTPFTEPDCVASPAIPPRPAYSLTPLSSKLLGKRTDRNMASRSDSFTVAVNGDDMEMRSIIKSQQISEEKPENVYDAVYGESGNNRQVVAVDIHRHSPPSLEVGAAGIYDRIPLRDLTRTYSVDGNNSPGMASVAATNEMYFEMNGFGNNREKENAPPRSPRSKSATRPINSLPLTEAKNLGLSSNSVILSHPLAMFSTDGVPSTPSISGSGSSRCGPMLFSESKTSSSLLQSVYADCSDYAASTDI